MSNTNNTNESRKCSFCGRGEGEVSLLLPSQDRKSFICDNCISVCADFIEEHFAPQIEDEGEVYETIEDIWPDYPQKEDFLWDEEEY